MISIAMTTYNGEKYVARQLRTLLEQTLPADEIIICDDCSKDNTIRIIREIIAQTGCEHVRLIENAENLGYIRNFYKAISLTSGDYIFLADQDDEWHPDKIEKTLRALREKNAAAVCTNSSLIDQDSNPLDKAQFLINPFIKNAGEGMNPISFWQLVLGNIAQGCTYCFTKAVKQVYLELNSQNLIHDYQIMFIAALTGGAWFLNEELLDYRLHGNNSLGFDKASEVPLVKLKVPSRKPYMVRFMEDLGRVLKVPHKQWYIFLYYLRIPYFISIYHYRRGK